MPTHNQAPARDVFEYDIGDQGIDHHVTEVWFRGKCQKTLFTKSFATKDGYAFALFDMRLLGDKLIHVVNVSGVSMTYKIEASLDSQSFETLKADTVLASGSAYEILSNIWCVVKISVKSTAAATPTNCRLLGSGQN